MNYFTKNLQQKTLAKQDFSVNDLLEDIQRLSKTSSKEVVSVYSELVTSLVRLQKEIKLPKAILTSLFSLQNP